MNYVMDYKGSTFGAVTGKEYTFAPGQTIPAPEGEFRHLPKGSYQTSDLTEGEYNTRPLDAEEKPRVEQKGRYFYVYQGDELMNHLAREDGEDKGISEDEANELLSQLEE